MKRILALLTVLLLLTGCTGNDYLEVVDPEPVVSSSSTGAAAASAPFALTLGTVLGKQGAQVAVPLSVSGNAYLVNADLLIEYDPACLKPVIADENLGCAVKADWQAGLWCGEQEAGVLRLMLADTGVGSAAVMTLCTLKFEVLQETEAPLTLTVAAAGVCLPDGELTDALSENLVTTGNGCVTPL